MLCFLVLLYCPNKNCQHIKFYPVSLTLKKKKNKKKLATLEQLSFYKQITTQKSKAHLG